MADFALGVSPAIIRTVGLETVYNER